MVDFLKSMMTPDLLLGTLAIVKLINNMFWFVKIKLGCSSLVKSEKSPINKLDFNIDKGNFHCDFHLRR